MLDWFSDLSFYNLFSTVYSKFSLFLGYLIAPLIFLLLILALVYFASVGLRVTFKNYRENNKVARAKEQREEFISFMKNVYIAVFWGPPKTGKTALLNFFACLTPLEWAGNKYTSFPTSSIHAQPFNISSIDLYSELKLLPEGSTVLIDEFNQIDDFTRPNDPAFKKRMEGFLRFIPYVGHCGNHLFVGNQRTGGGVWNAVRDIANLFVHCKGHEKIGSDFLFSFDTAENEAMDKNFRSWTIWLSPHEMASYDPKWMGPVLNSKNTALDFAKKVGAKHILEFIEKLDKISESTGLDENIVAPLLGLYKQQLGELIAINKYRKPIDNDSINNQINNRIPRFTSKEKTIK